MTTTGSLLPGTIMHNRYRLIRSLSRGGMGALYLASETIAHLERRVVIKEMLDYYDPADPSGAARARKRFEDEAMTLASLPSIAGVPQIFEYFSENGHNYIVMQYIEGRNLESGLTHVDASDRLAPGGAYPVEQVRRWGVRVCQILARLAEENLVHMDIKPANLIVDPAGDIWLVDFGTARGKYTVPFAASGKIHKPSIYGTMGYAPPEQFAGKPEPRSDVYALAATLYHLMTDDDPAASQPPFAHMDRLPPEIAHALRLALESDVSRRITAAELGRLLAAPAKHTPFHWRDGTRTYYPEDLGVTADRNWEEALEYFSNGSWGRWFQDIHRYDLAQQLQTARLGAQDPEIALDQFLRRLDPNLPAAQLHLSALPTNVGILPWREQRNLELSVENRGAGCLRASFPNLPAGLRVEPAEVTVNRSAMIRLTLDGAMLSPRRGRRQALPLTADAGPAGTARLVFHVAVPEPVLAVDSDRIHLGNARPDERLTTTLSVTNRGGSPLELIVASSAPWLQVQTAGGTCAPDKTHTLRLAIDTRGLAFGAHSANVTLHARAGDWKTAQTVTITLNVSFWLAAYEALRLPVLWAGASAITCGALGWLIGQLIETIEPTVHTLAGMLTTGALMGAFIYAFGGLAFGLMGMLEDHEGSEGARRGFLAGLIPGLLVGALAGFIVYRVADWVTSTVYPVMTLSTFGASAGLLIGAGLGLLLFWFTRD
jgi:serine/threonine protein kinase